MKKTQLTLRSSMIILFITCISMVSCGENFANNRSSTISSNTINESQYLEQLNLLVPEKLMLKTPGFENPIICTYHNVSVEKDTLCLNYEAAQANVTINSGL